MAAASTNPKRSPSTYGGLLTKVFQHFRVSLEKEPEHRLTNPFTKSTITKMKLTHIEPPTIQWRMHKFRGRMLMLQGSEEIILLVDQIFHLLATSTLVYFTWMSNNATWSNSLLPFGMRLEISLIALLRACKPSPTLSLSIRHLLSLRLLRS